MASTRLHGRRGAVTVSGQLVALWLVTATAPPLAAQAVDTASYFFAGRSVPLTVHLDSLGLYAPGVDDSTVGSLGAGLDGGGVRAMGKGLFVIGFGAPTERSALVARARLAVELGGGAIQAAGLVVRRAGAPDPAFVTDQFIAEFQLWVTPAQIDSLNAVHGVHVVRRLGVLRNDYLLAATPQSRQDALDLANLYHQSPAVVFASPDFFGLKRERAFTPGDQLFPDQWHLHNANDADIDAPEAWSITRGSADVVIAILEPFGFDKTHADLATKIDHAWSFDGCGSTADFGQTTPCGASTFGPKQNHGTAVAGLAAAEGDNGEGIAGVCLECRLMVIELPISDAATGLAIDHVAARGVDVINNSWTWAYSNDYTLAAFVEAAEVTPSQQGIVVVFSTEDDRDDHCTEGGGLGQLYAHPDLIAVSASNNLDRRADASTIGSCVELLAPGYYATVVAAGDTLEQSGIVTTDRTGSAGYNTSAPIQPITCAFAEPTATSATNGLSYTRCFSGGSASAPIVAGVAGLLRSLKPCLTRVQVQEILRSTADKIGPPGTYDPVTGHSPSYGYGRVNAAAALQAASGASCPTVAVTPPPSQGPAVEFGTRAGITGLLNANDQAIANGPGGGPMAEPVVHVAWFPTPSWMMEAQVGISFLTQAVGPNRTNLVVALQTAYGFGGFGNATLFVGPNVAFQYLATGTLPSTNDAALGLAFGYRWLPLTFLAVRLEARYRYWLDRMIHETGGALGFGVVIP